MHMCVYVYQFGFHVGFRLEDGKCLTLSSWALGSDTFCAQMQSVLLLSAVWFQLAEKIIFIPHPRVNRYLPLAQGTMAWVFKACYLFQVQRNTYFLTTTFNIDPMLMGLSSVFFHLCSQNYKHCVLKMYPYMPELFSRNLYAVIKISL